MKAMQCIFLQVILTLKNTPRTLELPSVYTGIRQKNLNMEFKINTNLMKKLLKYFKQFVLTSFLGTTSFSEHRTAKGGTAANSASMCWSGFLTNRQMSWVSIVCRLAGSGFSV